MKEYQKPDVEIIEFSISDVITATLPGGVGGITESGEIEAEEEE